MLIHNLKKMKIFLEIISFMFIIQQIQVTNGYKDCRGIDYNEDDSLTTYYTVQDFISTSDGKTCKIEVSEGLPILKSRLLDAKPKSYYIRKIILQNNAIETIESDPFVSSAVCIVVLDLSHNLITRIEPDAFSSLTQLQKLDLSYNKLKTLNSSIFAQTNKLDVLLLNNNELETFENIPNLRNLTVLELSNNKLILKPSMFKNFTKLIQLNIEYNNISYIPLGLFEGLDNLEILRLGHNQLKSFATGTFSGLKSLKVFNISYNFVSTIELLDEKVFFPISKIQTLILDGNVNLTSLDASELNRIFPRLLYLGIGNMPWKCDELLSFFKICTKHYIDFTKHVDRTYHEHNIHGIKCIETDVKKQQQITERTENIDVDTVKPSSVETNEIVTQTMRNVELSVDAMSSKQTVAANDTTENVERIALLRELKILCIFLIILVIVLFGIFIFKDKLNFYRRRIYVSRTVPSYKNERTNMNSLDEPECNIDLITQMS